MRELIANNYKKILLLLVVFFCFISIIINLLFNISSAVNYQLIDNKVNSIFTTLDEKSFKRQEDFYKLLKSQINEKKLILKNTNTVEGIIYIESKFDTKYSLYKKAEEERIKEVKKNLIHSSHKTLILHFYRNGEHISLINKYKNKIEQGRSVFIFKNGNDLTRSDIKIITKRINEINPNTLIFIDQEGGWINRYIEFENSGEIDAYFSDSEIDKKIRTIFPNNIGYFPSLQKIGELYESFDSTEDKEYFLEKIASIRLASIKDNGINTYGLVLDLNRGNPVIANYARSFSSDLEKYKLLVDTFTQASEETGVHLYFKHFPGHGSGIVDSHKGILNLLGEEAYLKENIELFNYALSNNINGGLMVGHMYIPNSLKKTFQESIHTAAYILTDDLGMQGFKLATNKEKQGLFFSTDQVLTHHKLITVDSINVNGIK